MPEKECSITVSLPHMIDLALGAPEVGAVNFNVLHSLLHVIIQQMDLTRTQVEFRGPDCERIKTILQTSKSTPTLKLTEYMVTELDSKGNVIKKDKGSKEKDKEEKKKSDDKKEKEKSEDKKDKSDKEKDKKKDKDVEMKKSSVVLVQAADKGKDKDKAKKSKVSPDDLDKVDKKVDKLKQEVEDLKSLPSHEDLINRSRSGSQIAPVNDAWQITNLTRRLDAAEEFITKLSAMIEELAKGKDITIETPKFTPGESSKGDSERLDKLEKRVSKLEKMPPGSGPSQDAGGRSEAPPRESPDYDEMTTDQIIVALRDELKEVREEVDNIDSQIKQITSITDRIPFQAFMDGIKEIDDLREKFEAFAGLMKEKCPEPSEAAEEQNKERIAELEEKLNMCTGQMEGMDTTITTQMDSVQQQISDLEKELGEILEKVNTGTPMGDTFAQDFAGLSDLYNKVQIIQGDMENLNQTATRLMDDREERQMHIEALLEQIESIKTLKADKEDLDDALAEKADQNVVNRKVSHDQFDAACDDLSRGLEEALAKLTQQETLWQQALDDIQREIENKLDKIELSPLKDFVNSKLKALQERLKALANMRKDTEAAGTKIRFLRNVNCISCDKDVVMKSRLETPGVPAPDPLPATRSMRPYLTYELDQVRKQQRRPQGKNMLHLEEAEREQERSKRGGPQDGRSPEYLCNRYCGGSHTVTTPQQRVTRLGHFLTQWGPEAIQLTEGTIRGTDGQMYRSREPAKRPSISKVESPTSVLKRGAAGAPSPPGTPKRGSAGDVTPSRRGSALAATKSSSIPSTGSGAKVASQTAAPVKSSSLTKATGSPVTSKPASPATSKPGSPATSKAASPVTSKAGSPATSPKAGSSEQVAPGSPKEGSAAELVPESTEEQPAGDQPTEEAPPADQEATEAPEAPEDSEAPAEAPAEAPPEASEAPETAEEPPPPEPAEEAAAEPPAEPAE